MRAEKAKKERDERDELARREREERQRRDERERDERQRRERDERERGATRRCDAFGFLSLIVGCVSEERARREATTPPRGNASMPALKTPPPQRDNIIHCARCRLAIDGDSSVEADGATYHTNCFRCVECSKVLGSQYFSSTAGPQVRCVDVIRERVFYSRRRFAHSARRALLRRKLKRAPSVARTSRCACRAELASA